MEQFRNYSSEHCFGAFFLRGVILYVAAVPIPKAFGTGSACVQIAHPKECGNNIPGMDFSLEIHGFFIDVFPRMRQ